MHLKTRLKIRNIWKSWLKWISNTVITLHCCITALNKTSSGRSPPSSSEAQLDMKTMYRHVVSKLSPYWTTVSDYLEYSVVERNSFRAANSKKSLTALLENWISTDNGRKPKTWSTFIEVLEELDQHLSISVGREIGTSLNAKVCSPSGKWHCVVVQSYLWHVHC